MMSYMETGIMPMRGEKKIWPTTDELSDWEAMSLQKVIDDKEFKEPCSFFTSYEDHLPIFLQMWEYLYLE